MGLLLQNMRCVHELKGKVTAFVLKDVPPVLFLGKIRGDLNYSYVWETENPYLEHKKTKRKIHCLTNQNVPMIFPAGSELFEDFENSDSSAGGDSVHEVKEAKKEEIRQETKIKTEPKEEIQENEKEKET